jgi:hypothetical protein
MNQRGSQSGLTRRAAQPADRLLCNGVQSIRGGQGAFSGSVSYAVEVYDGASGQLLKAYVSKQYPNAMNLPAAFGSLGAAKTGLDKGADALVAQLH